MYSFARRVATNSTGGGAEVPKRNNNVDRRIVLDSVDAASELCW